MSSSFRGDSFARRRSKALRPERPTTRSTSRRARDETIDAPSALAGSTVGFLVVPRVSRRDGVVGCYAWPRYAQRRCARRGTPTGSSEPPSVDGNFLSAHTASRRVGASPSRFKPSRALVVAGAHTSAAVADASASASMSRPPLDVSAFDRSNLTVYLKDVVTLVLGELPGIPSRSSRTTSRRVLSGASPLSRAYQYLTLSPHYRQAFVDNATVAFSVLDAGPRGLTGADPPSSYALLSDAPGDVSPGPPQTRSPEPDASVDFFEFLASAYELLVGLDDAFRSEAARAWRPTTTTPAELPERDSRG